MTPIAPAAAPTASAAPSRPASFTPVQVVGAAIAVAAFFMHRNATLNHFYFFGGSLDANWFAGMLWLGDWMLPDGPSVDTLSQYAFHLCLLMAPFAVVSHFFHGDAIAWFADLMGVWHAGINVAMVWVIARVCRQRGLEPVATAGVAATLGALFLLSPQQASFVGTPHYQILIPAFAIACIGTYACGRRGWAIVWFVCLLATREDCGFHAATFFAPLALVTRWQTGRWSRFEISLAVIGVVWSCIAFPLGPWLAGAYGHSAGAAFVGDPPFAHVTLDQIAYRVDQFMWQSGHIWVPLAVVLGFAWWRRDPLLAVGPIATFPWLFLHLIVGNYPPAFLFSYHYLFPFVIALAWPALTALLRGGPLARPGDARGLLLVQAIALAASFTPMLGKDKLYYGSRWGLVRYTLTEDARNADRTQAFMFALVWGRNELGKLTMEPNLTSFAPRHIPRSLWVESARWRRDPPSSIDSIALLDMPWCGRDLLDFVKEADLPHEYVMLGTRIVLLSRKRLDEIPTFAPLVKEVPRRTGEFCGRWEPLRDAPRP